MIKIGMILGDRYEILEKIGTGGMSDVYKAKDHKLSRFIAVKVLKQEFSENANFVSKFKIEAQAAAGLMHPNIVNVYDVGEEGGIYYIVMELVEGITLKKYIEKKARLSVKEAVSIAIQVCMGIEAAHNNHIIHRDIKPQNIIISKEGKVKVTDFGIAKAATSNTITSNVMGSVHYTSPEQARGGYSDERSDIYSLGITLFEMLTGRLPFNGETTVAIAIKHIQEDMPSPREYISEIPVSVEKIVCKCCQKSPDRRYQSMPELIVDLKQSLINPDQDFVKMIAPDEEAVTRNVSDEEMAQIKKQTKKIDAYDEKIRVNKENKRPSGKDAGKKNSGKKDSNKKQPQKKTHTAPMAEAYEDDDYDPKMERMTTLFAVLAAVLVGLIIIFLVGRAVGLFQFGTIIKPKPEQQEAVQTVEMPQVVGKTLDEAKTLLLQAGLTPEIEYQESAADKEGIVLFSSETAGIMVELGTNVILTVGQGTNGIPVPDITGLSQAEAKSTLEQLGFTVNVVEQSDETVKSGMVISMNPEGNTTAPAGSTITVYISIGGTQSGKIKVPNVTGIDEMDAIVMLTEAGLVVGTVSEVNHDDLSLSGKVCYQSYSADTYVDKGTVIDLRVSIGAREATYYYSGSITAPTEDPDYESGMSVLINVTGADGSSIISNRNVEVFPYDIPRIDGIKTPVGTITLTFTVVKESVTVTDPETGETTTTEGSTTQKTVTREVTFTQE